MSPGELAQLTGVSTDTLRHYERKGLLPVPARTASGYRRYTDADLARVTLIRRALAIGFSIPDLARVLREREAGGVPCRQVHALVTARLTRVDREIEALVVLKRDLTAMLDDWTRRLARTPAGRQARLLDRLPAGAAAAPARVRRRPR